MRIHTKIGYILLTLGVFANGLLLYPKWESAPKARVLGSKTPELLRGSGLQKTPVFPTKVTQPDISGVQASAFLVFDKDTGTLLLEKNTDTQVAIASLTKLMTALLALENLDLHTPITITSADVVDVKPIIGFTPGEQYQGQDLLMAMLIGSCNDAAQALGNRIAAVKGVSIADAMNAKASELGMVNSHFMNAIGFDEQGNYSTAGDLAVLVKAILGHGVTELIGRSTSFQIVSEQGRSTLIKSTNRLLKSHIDIEAIKTGATPEAKGAMITQVNIDGHTVCIIVLQSMDREGDTLLLKKAVAESIRW